MLVLSYVLIYWVLHRLPHLPLGQSLKLIWVFFHLISIKPVASSISWHFKILSLKHILVERIDSQNLVIHNKCNINDNSSSLWRHYERDGVSNHQPHDCLLKRLYRRRPKKTSKLRVTGLCVENSSVTGEFPAQRASNAENVTIWWRCHV